MIATCRRSAPRPSRARHFQIRQSKELVPMKSITAPPGLLAGKVAIITGASMGIGEAAAEYFAAAGASVVLAARSVDKLKAVVERIESAGGTALSIQTDVRD